ncbi:trypsin-like peptidase domain-containing protein [Candidatus Pacearchaeota archaeon]|nr:trypsin-like peptidase domain-containing protein [Candidatus Pacearchaeota archaeon]
MNFIKIKNETFFGTIYYFSVKIKNVENSVISVSDNLNNKIELNDKNMQSKINSLTEAINSLSMNQSDLKTQIGQIKATTSADFSGIIEQDIKGVVTIKTDAAQGTGFILTEDGYIVTNAHVLSGARYANIYTYDNNRYSASLVGYDSEIDIALLKVSGEFFKLILGNSDEVRIGEKVIAIGNPLGLSFTATEGIISAREREGDNGLPYYFQTDVSLNPGNSGGPLINTKGEVIGINNFKISGAENIGFALESKYIEQTIDDISLRELNMTII